MNNVFGKLSWNKRALVIFDQLNPSYAKYYTKEEALKLMASAPFKDVHCYHRHGYSWTLVGTKK